MKTIAYITHYAPIPSTKADAICVMETCNAIAKQGYKLELIIPSYNVDAVEVDNEQKIWDYYNIKKSFKITRLPAKFLYKLGFFGRIIYKIMSVFIGIWKKNDLFYFRHVELSLLAGLLGKKLILAHHDLSSIENSLALKLLVNIAKRRKIYFISITQAGAKRLQNFGVKKGKILVAPMGVNVEKYSISVNCTAIREKLGLPNNKTIVLYSGSLYKGRGIEELIGGMHSFPELLLVVVGGNQKDIERCKSLIKKKGQGNIHFVGFVQPNLVPEYLLSADMLVMPYTTNTPTHKDMSPMKMFDYMASGKPIISSDFPVLQEILTDKVNALLVKPGCANAIAEGIQWILDNPEKANEIGQQARIDVEEFTWDKRAEKIASLILDSDS